MDSKVDKILSNLSENQEFEIKFNYKDQSITIDLFQDLLRKAKAYSQEEGKEIQVSSELDICYNFKDNSFDVYRLSVTGLENINEAIKVYANKPNNITFSLLAPKARLILKEKDKYKDTTFYDDNFNVRCRLSDEIPTKPNKRILNLPEMEKLNIFFRYKNRVSLIIEDNDSYRISLDITSVKSSKILMTLGSGTFFYEVEYEFFKKSDAKVSKSDVEKYNTFFKKILQWVNRTENLMSNEEKGKLLQSYKDLIGNQDLIRLYSMHPEALNLPRLSDYLANNYAVTDKADGEKICLFTKDGKVYIITNTLDVQFTGVEDKNIKDNSLVEGEYIREDDVIMLFDIIYLDGNDVRKLNLHNRIKKLDEFISNVNSKCFKFKDYDRKDITVQELEKFYEEEIKQFIEHLNSKKSKIERKIFLIPLGIDDCEIFKYSVLLWRLMKDVFYKLDGLIYTGITQKYTSIKREIEFPTLKWKPEELNTIDIYMEFVKNDKNEIQEVFDNSDADTTENQIFRIANLYVGSIKDGKETPVPFMPKEKLNQAYFYLLNGQVRDIEGNLVSDKTVIELAYNPNDSVPPPYRWQILRTRYDKTYSVQQYRRQYGNNEMVARKVFETIMNPIRLIDLEKLGHDYQNYIEIIKQRVSTKLIEITKQEDAYFQFKSNLAQPMTKFHNYIKDILFQYYMPKKLKNGTLKKMTVLDIGIGRGADLLKYYHHDVKEVVGIDPDYNGLYNASDSAFSRYENQRKKKPYFTPMTFIQASAGEILDVKKQAALFPTMSDTNKEMLKKLSNRKFDCINSSFALHYMFYTEGFGNLIKNINKFLGKNGYLTFTTFDADLVKKYLNGEKEKSEYFTDEEGVKRIFITIKDISIGDNPGIDQAIDFFTAMFMNEGTYQTEYLVYYDFVVKEMREKCNLKLVESMTFKEIMEKQEYFFAETVKTESDPYRKKFFEENVKKFYDDTSNLNTVSKRLSHLYRFYVFQKQD